jgi:hypothetical protein
MEEMTDIELCQRLERKYEDDADVREIIWRLKETQRLFDEFRKGTPCNPSLG